MRRFFITFLIIFLLCGCSSETEAEQKVEATQPPAATAEPTVETVPPETMDSSLEVQAIAEEPPMPVSVVLRPEAPGLLEERCEEAVIDYSHTENGYVMVRYFAETEQRLKVLVKGPSTTYAYNLPVDEWTTFPLSDGNGAYTVGVYSNVTGNKYAVVMTAQITAEMNDEFAPFLRPNQYVDYTFASETVAMGANLCVGLEHPLEKVAAVYDHVIHHFTYDYEKAKTVTSGYLPKLDEVLAAQTGICFDYAALMTAMLRSQEVPCKLVVGYAGSVYHAWISVWTEENGWIDGAIFFDGNTWMRMDPTFASSGEGDPEIMNFIQNGAYKALYLY